MDCEEVIELEPRNVAARTSKAFLLAIAKDASTRDPAEALRLAEEVLSEYGGNGYAKNAKSCALAAKGDFAAAIDLQHSVADTLWLHDDGIAGGILRAKRIAAWELGKLWHP